MPCWGPNVDLIGIDPKDIPYTFTPVNPKFTKNPEKTLGDLGARFKTHPAGQRWVNEHYGEKHAHLFQWDNPRHSSWLDVPAAVLYEVFTFEECAKMWIGSFIMSRLSQYIDDKHEFLRKVENTHWRYGFIREWNLLARHMEGLKRLDFGVPDFEVRLVHTNPSCMQAWSVQIRTLYLDASLGVAIYYKGEHVLTTSFALTDEGVMVAQVQLRQKKGNRFLYKLPKPYVEMILDMYTRAFTEDQVFLVEGKSAAESVRNAYGNSVPDTFTSEVATQIEKVYNRPLDTYEMGTAVKSLFGRVYRPVFPKNGRMRLAA